MEEKAVIAIGDVKFNDKLRDENKAAKINS
jgi:hypothetical protein